MESVSFQMSEKEEEFNISSKTPCMGLLWENFTSIEIFRPKSSRPFFFPCILFGENTSPDQATIGNEATENIQ